VHAATRSPTDRRRCVSDARRGASSSTTQTIASPAVMTLLASARGAIIRRLALEVMGPHTPSAVPTYRHRSAPVPTCRHPLPVWGTCRRDPPSALPAAQNVIRRAMVGGPPGRVQRWHRTCTRAVQQQRATAGGDAGRALWVPQKPGATGLSHALETGPVAPLTSQGEAGRRKGGHPHGPDHIPYSLVVTP
jgi:hypothetical protein